VQKASPGRAAGVSTFDFAASEIIPPEPWRAGDFRSVGLCLRGPQKEYGPDRVGQSEKTEALLRGLAARMSPGDKAALVTALGAGETLFVGDGVNDALAFERAAIAGTPVLDRPTLPARADFVVTSGHLGPVAELVYLAQRVRTITLRNVAIAAVYNALALVAGIQGWLSPVVAALAMPASSLLVLALTTLSSRERRSGAAAPAPSTEGTAPWMPSTSPSS